MYKKIFHITAILSLLIGTALSHPLRPPIASVNPGMNATGIERNALVTVSFTAPMLPASLNASSVFLYGDRSGRHNGNINYNPAAGAVTVTSLKNFIFGEQIQFILTDSVGTSDPYQKINGGFSYKFVAGVLQGNGQFTVQEQPISTTPSPYAVAAGDLNQDGYTDCVVTEKNSDSVAVYFNNHRNGFHPRVPMAAGNSPEAIAIADITADGRPDFVVANRLSNSITLFTNDGGGNFTGQEFLIGIEPAALAVADCNNDSMPDIATVSPSDSSFHIYSYINSSLVLQRSVHVTGIPSGVILEDLNNDGFIDGAVSVKSRNRLVLLRNDSLGQMKYDTAYGVGSSPVAVIAYDAVLGSDGFVDLATLNSGTNNLSILKNDGTGRFQGPEHFDIGGAGPAAICGNDFDGDGDVDLAITNSGSNSVVVFRNNGEALPDIFTTSLNASPLGIAALDVTGEYGIMDLIVSNPLAGTLFVLRNGFISPPPPEITINNKSVVVVPTAVNDTNNAAVFFQSSLTPARIDSVSFASAHFSTGAVFPIFLASYDSGSIDIRYVPQSYGEHIDTLRFFTTAGTLSIPVSAESPHPVLSASASQVQFGIVTVSDTGFAKITLRSGSINPVRIDSATVGQSVFSVPATDFPVILHNNDSVVVDVWFIPTASDDYSDTLVVRCTPSSSNLSIVLQGKGDPSVGVNDGTNRIPSEFLLYQNYPNPFNPETTIGYGLPAEGFVTITVHDVVGRKIQTLVEAEREAGYYSVYWNAQQYASGLYMYRMQVRTGSKIIVQSKKLLLLK